MPRRSPDHHSGSLSPPAAAAWVEGREIRQAAAAGGVERCDVEGGAGADARAGQAQALSELPAAKGAQGCQAAAAHARRRVQELRVPSTSRLAAIQPGHCLAGSRPKRAHEEDSFSVQPAR